MIMKVIIQQQHILAGNIFSLTFFYLCVLSGNLLHLHVSFIHQEDESQLLVAITHINAEQLL